MYIQYQSTLEYIIKYVGYLYNVPSAYAIKNKTSCFSLTAIGCSVCFGTECLSLCLHGIVLRASWLNVSLDCQTLTKAVLSLLIH